MPMDSPNIWLPHRRICSTSLLVRWPTIVPIQGYEASFVRKELKHTGCAYALRITPSTVRTANRFDRLTTWQVTPPRMQEREA